VQKCERETNLLINQQDLADGFFVFGTSERHHYQKVLKRCAGGILSDKQLGTKECPYWQLKIDAKCLSPATLGLRAYTRVAVSPESIERRCRQLAESRQKRKPAA